MAEHVHDAATEAAHAERPQALMLREMRMYAPDPPAQSRDQLTLLRDELVWVENTEPFRTGNSTLREYADGLRSDIARVEAGGEIEHQFQWLSRFQNGHEWTQSRPGRPARVRF